jgi:hypothetical protein
VSAAELIRRLTQAGVRLTPHGDRLRVDAPRGLLSPDDWASLAARKGEILALLRADLVADDQALRVARRELAAEGDHEPVDATDGS